MVRRDRGGLILLLCGWLGTASGLGLAGCERLNPEWCARHARCAPGEICDPTTNTCQAREGGVGDARLDGRRDASSVDSGGDFARDREMERAPFQEGGPRDAPSGPCTPGPGGWGCLAGSAGFCGDGGFSRQRNCPLGECTSGHCQVPGSPTHCTRNAQCSGQWRCTLLLSAGTTSSVCAAPVSGNASPGPCTTGLDCSTGLCTASSLCYYACDGDADCSNDHKCRTVNLLVEGVLASAKTCEPP
jgi:hypothetical protein